MYRKFRNDGSDSDTHVLKGGIEALKSETSETLELDDFDSVSFKSRSRALEMIFKIAAQT